MGFINEKEVISEDEGIVKELNNIINLLKSKGFYDEDVEKALRGFKIKLLEALVS